MLKLKAFNPKVKLVIREYENVTATPFWSQIAAQAKADGRPFFTMAPMEAVSNTVFRQVISHAAAPDTFF